MFLSPLFVIYLATCALAAPTPLAPRSLEGERPESLFKRGFLLKTLTKAVPSVIKTTEHVAPKLITKVDNPKPPMHVLGPISKLHLPISPSKVKPISQRGVPLTHNHPDTNSGHGHFTPQQGPKHPTTFNVHTLKPTSHPDTHSNHGTAHPTSHTLERNPTGPNHDTNSGHGHVTQQQGPKHPSMFNLHTVKPTHPDTYSNHGTAHPTSRTLEHLNPAAPNHGHSQPASLSQQHSLKPNGGHSQTSTHPVDVSRAPTTHGLPYHEHDGLHLGSPQWGTPGMRQAGERALLGHEIRHDLAVEHRVEQRVAEMHRDARLLNAGAGPGFGRYDGFRPLPYGGRFGYGGPRLY